MSTPPHPPLEGQPATTTYPQDAEPTTRQRSVGEPKGIAEGVPTAVRPDPQPGDGRYPIAWLTICALRGAIPTATSKCLCGRDRSAVGRPRVLALITDHETHRDICPLRSSQEGRTAA